MRPIVCARVTTPILDSLHPHSRAQSTIRVFMGRTVIPHPAAMARVSSLPQPSIAGCDRQPPPRASPAHAGAVHRAWPHGTDRLSPRAAALAFVSSLTHPSIAGWYTRPAMPPSPLRASPALAGAVHRAWPHGTLLGQVHCHAPSVAGLIFTQPQHAGLDILDRLSSRWCGARVHPLRLGRHLP